MRFLADESCDYAIVRALRAAGHAGKRGVGGVIFLRSPAKMRADISRAVVNLVGRRGDALTGRFIVVQPGRVRIGRTP